MNVTLHLSDIRVTGA